jgi:hypothetical protein
MSSGYYSEGLTIGGQSQSSIPGQGPVSTLPGQRQVAEVSIPGWSGQGQGPVGQGQAWSGQGQGQGMVGQGQGMVGQGQGMVGQGQGMVGQGQGMVGQGQGMVGQGQAWSGQGPVGQGQGQPPMDTKGRWHFQEPRDLRGPVLSGENCNAFTCSNKGWCLPVWIYMVLALIGLLGYIFSLHSLGAVLVYLVINIILILIIIFLLYNLCYYNRVGLAWLLLFLPLILEIGWIITVSLVKF